MGNLLSKLQIEHKFWGTYVTIIFKLVQNWDALQYFLLLTTFQSFIERYSEKFYVDSGGSNFARKISLVLFTSICKSFPFECERTNCNNFFQSSKTVFVGKTCGRGLIWRFLKDSSFVPNLLIESKFNFFLTLKMDGRFDQNDVFSKNKDSLSSVKMLIKDFFSSKLLIAICLMKFKKKNLKIRLTQRFKRNPRFVIFLQFLQVFFSLILLALPCLSQLWAKEAMPQKHSFLSFVI